MKLKVASAFAAALMAACLFAEEEDLAAKVPEKKRENPFFTLPLCRRVEGGGEVKKPQSADWTPIEEGKFYPLGSSYRAPTKGTLTIAFGKECSITVKDGSSFATRAQPLGGVSRTIVLTGGEVALSIAPAVGPGAFFVTTPAFTVQNPSGESVYVYRDKDDGFESEIRCTAGTLEVEGRHFKILSMDSADAITVRATSDNLETILYGKSGDMVLRLDRGLLTREEIQDDASVKTVIESGFLDWHLSVGTRVQINRAVPAIGKRLSVTMMTFNAAGEMQNNFAFAEGRAEVNSGELVKKADNSEEVSQKAAEVTDEAAADTEETTAEATSAGKTEEKKDDAATTADSGDDF